MVTSIINFRVQFSVIIFIVNNYFKDITVFKKAVIAIIIVKNVAVIVIEKAIIANCRLFFIADQKTVRFEIHFTNFTSY